MDKLRQKLLSKTNSLERLARGPKILRFLYNPFKYADVLNFNKKIYPKEGKSRLEKVKTFWGAEMQLLLPAGTDICLLGIKTHDSEIRLTRFLIKMLQKGDIFIDAGAHFGFYSLLAAYLMNNEGIIISAEASKTIFEVLTRNLQGQTAVRPVHRALTSSDTESIEFTEFPILYSEYNTLHAEQFADTEWFKSVKPEKIQIQGSRLDSLLPFFLLMAKGLNPEANYFVKIDVEGAEKEVIEGFSKFLENPELKGRIYIIMEYWANNGIKGSHEEAVEYLKDKGFDPYLIDKKGTLSKLVDLNIIKDSENIVFRQSDKPTITGS